MRSARRLSTLMLMRSSPASRSSGADLRQVERHSSTARCPSISGTARSMRISSWICGRIVGSPPVIRSRRSPSGASWRTTLGDLLVRENLRLGQPLHSRLGHAVHAAEVAAIGDRDAQILDAAARTGRAASGRAASMRRRAHRRRPSTALRSRCAARVRPTRAFRRRSARASRSERAA